MNTNKKLNQLCKDSGISYLGLFGSHSRGEQKEDSDVDLLVKFVNPIGYFKLLEVEEKLEDYFQKNVDLVTKNALSKYIKPGVYNDLKTLYGKR